MKIQLPTLGRVVIFTAARGTGDAGVVDEYMGLVVGVQHASAGIVSLVTFGPLSSYHTLDVPFSNDGLVGTWRYPPRVMDEIEVDG